MFRRAVLCIVALVATALVAVPGPAEAWSRGPVRIAGIDRYQTSVDLSNAAFPEGATSAVVVSGTAFPDGLSAGPLAALQQSPVLLTLPDALPGTVATELVRLKAASVTVVGGSSAVSDTVLEEITAATGVTPLRIFGTNRYETAAQVATLFPGGVPAVYVASGVDFPDALAGGAAAALAGVPLLLTEPTSAPQATTDALIRLRPAEVRVLGGEAAVSEAVVSQLRTIVPSVRRIFGADRYATAQALATDGGRRPAEVLVATADSFPDALAAAPLAARRGAPILLSAPPCAPQATLDAQRDLQWPDVTIIGGRGIVSPAAGAGVPCSPVRDGLLAPGLLLTTQVLPGPRVVHLLTVDRRQGFDIRTVTGRDQVNGLFPTTGINRKLLVPLVTVNGDFFDPSGEPTHALASGGRLLRWPGSLVNTLVGFDPAKPGYAFFGKPTGGVDLDRGAAGSPLGIGLVNMRPPAGEELALLTPERTRAFPEGDWCRAVLRPSGTPYIEADRQRTIQPSTVESAGCGTGPVPRTGDVLVAAAGSATGDTLASLTPGSAVNIRWKVHPTASGILDAIGANATLVFGAQVASDVVRGTGTFYARREARTAVAQRGDGTVLIAVVDKRPGWSIGMTPRELAEHLVRMGAHDAANLDGGGSSAMSVRGVLKNRPSDGVERNVNTALVVVPHGVDVSIASRRR